MIDPAPAFIGNAGVRTTVGSIPILCRMALGTIGTEHSRMIRGVTMTAYTCGGQPYKRTCRMALFASQPDMAPREREVATIVVEGRIFPTGRVMAGSTIGAVFTIMLVVLPVAGITVSGGTSEDTVLMTGFTFHFGVFTLQLEYGQVVIELRGLPAVHRVTIGAVRAKAPLVWFVCAMTRETILWRILEIGKRPCIEMAFDADYVGVHAG